MPEEGFRDQGLDQGLPLSPRFYSWELKQPLDVFDLLLAIVVVGLIGKGYINLLGN